MLWRPMGWPLCGFCSPRQNLLVWGKLKWNGLHHCDGGLPPVMVMHPTLFCPKPMGFAPGCTSSKYGEFNATTMAAPWAPQLPKRRPILAHVCFGGATWCPTHAKFNGEAGGWHPFCPICSGPKVIAQCLGPVWVQWGGGPPTPLAMGGHGPQTCPTQHHGHCFGGHHNCWCGHQGTTMGPSGQTWKKPAELAT